MVATDSPEGSYANVSIANGAIKVYVGAGDYLVKWFRDTSDLIGEMRLKNGFWGAFPNEEEVIDWKIEFWNPEGENLVFNHYQLIHGSDVLLNVSFDNSDGKINLSTLFEYADLLKSKGVNRVYCFMEESYKYDLESGGVIPLRFNQHMEYSAQFGYILNKTF